jgi:predicted Rdx family selenoprotein
LAAEIRARYPAADVQLTPSRGGRFEVVSDGIPIFEKSKLDRHARPGEIIALLEAQATDVNKGKGGPSR